MLLPLVIGGYVWSNYAVQTKSINIICDYNVRYSDEHCRPVDENYINYLNEQSNNSLVKVIDNYYKDRENYYNVWATPRMIGNIAIKSTKALNWVSDDFINSDELLFSLIDKSAVLGLSNNYASHANVSPIILNCYNLNLMNFNRSDINNDIFDAYCKSTDWRGVFTFIADQNSQKDMVALANDIHKEIQIYENNYILDKVFITFIPLALYIIISILSWLVFRAYKFVKAG